MPLYAPGAKYRKMISAVDPNYGLKLHRPREASLTHFEGNLTPNVKNRSKRPLQVCDKYEK